MAYLLMLLVLICFEEFSGSQVVYQHPEVEVNERDNVKLWCSVNHTSERLVGSYKWYKNGSSGKEVSNETHPTGILKVHPETFSKDKVASIVILSALEAYSGIYICEVELVGSKLKGNGTKLKVIKRHDNSDLQGKTGNSDCSKRTIEDAGIIIRTGLFSTLIVTSVIVTYGLAHKST